MTYINKVIKKHFAHRYADRGKISKQSKVTWFGILRRIRAAKWPRQSKIRI